MFWSLVRLWQKRVCSAIDLTFSDWIRARNKASELSSIHCHYTSWRTWPKLHGFLLLLNEWSNLRVIRRSVVALRSTKNWLLWLLVHFVLCFYLLVLKLLGQQTPSLLRVPHIRIICDGHFSIHLCIRLHLVPWQLWGPSNTRMVSQGSLAGLVPRPLFLQRLIKKITSQQYSCISDCKQNRSIFRWSWIPWPRTWSAGKCKCSVLQVLCWL